MALGIPDDLMAIRQAIVDNDVRLVVFDPLMAFLPDKVNSWKDQSIRRALAPLAKIAEGRITELATQQTGAPATVKHSDNGRQVDFIPFQAAQKIRAPSSPTDDHDSGSVVAFVHWLDSITYLLRDVCSPEGGFHRWYFMTILLQEP